jgi:HK97 family phage major capsid protein
MAAALTFIQEMREKRANIWEEMKSLNDKTKSENRDFTADEEKRYSDMDKDLSSLKVRIDREERLMNEENELNKRDYSGAGAPNGEQRGNDAEKQEAEHRAAFRKFIIQGEQGLDAREKQLMAEKRALAVGSAGAGGNTVPTGFYNDLIKALKLWGGMREVSRILPTASGNTLPIPTTNTTAQKGRLLAENTAASTLDPVFGQTSLGAYKFTSDIVLVSLEMMQDSAIDVEAFIRDEIAARIGRIQNQYYTTGSGTAEPQGVVTAAVSGKVGTTGQVSSVIFDDLVDLIHSVDPAYRAASKFMFHDQTLKVLKKMKDSQGRPLYLPGIALNEPDTINGYAYQINQDMATMAANAKSILFGAFNNFWIRDVMDVQITRFAEKYMDAGQIGFVAFARSDSKLINAGTNPIAYYANSAT